jgi:hypothetical protein
MNTLYGQNVEFLNVKLAVRIVITGFFFNYFPKSSKHKVPHCVIFPHAQTHY